MAPPAQSGGGSALSKLSLPAKVGVGFFVLLLIGAGYWLVFYLDVSKKIDAAKRQYDEKVKTRDQRLETREEYMRDRERLALAQQRARELSKILPAETQEAGFLQSVQMATNAAGLKLEGWSPQEERPVTIGPAGTGVAFYARVPMRLELSGKFHQIMKFSSEISKLDRIINLENIELVDVKQQGDEVTMRGRCLATAFHTLKPKAPAAQGAPK